jgi:hypothetical protein
MKGRKRGREEERKRESLADRMGARGESVMRVRGSGSEHHLHLLDGLLADDRLVHQHMVQHGAERVLGRNRRRDGRLDRLGNGDAERARARRVALQHLLADLGPATPRTPSAPRVAPPSARRHASSGARPHLSDGEAWHLAPNVSMYTERIGFVFFEIATWNTSTSRPKALPAYASEQPHCPAPVSVQSFWVPLSLL